MAFWRLFHLPTLGLLTFLLFLHHPTAATAAVIGTARINVQKLSANPPTFREAPIFRNGESCNSSNPKARIHIVMTLDVNYLRGSMAAILSILQHATCPEDTFFHFIAARVQADIVSPLRSTFPYLNFRVYKFNTSHVRSKISMSIRQALDQPLNYARIYLADMIPTDVRRIIYLDSDLIVVDDIGKLWDVELEGKVVAAPEYCHANFTKYFTEAFWFDPVLAGNFAGRRPCYFNTGVMVIDVERWREGHYREKIEDWMAVQKKTRIYQLGSLPPFLLVFAGNIKAIDHRWNQHGLGGDNLEGKCRDLHPGPISLLHWSGKGKPWLRLDSRKPCAVDSLWAPYDLFRSSSLYLEE